MISFTIYDERKTLAQGVNMVDLETIGYTNDIELANEIESQSDFTRTENGSTFQIKGSNLIPYLSELNIKSNNINVDKWYRVNYKY